MFIKRMFVVLLALCFLNFANFVVTPEPVYAQQTEAEREEEAWKSWRVVTGIAAVIFLVWIVASATKNASNSFDDEEPKAIAKKQKNQDQRINVDVDFAKFGYNPGFYNESFSESKDEWRSPELKVGYTW